METLTAHGVEFIVVGGVAAVLQGASLVTFDLDLVHSRRPENLERLLAALAELDARYRFPSEQSLSPAVSHLETSGHQLLMTRFGPLDVLGEIGHSHSYDDLLKDAVAFDIRPGLRVRALSLRRLIAVKKETANPKDLAALPVLERTLAESERA